MTNAKKQYSTEELESKYNDITILYDYAEELVATVETALRKIYVSVTEYQAKVCATSKSATSALKNIADPIVAKIQRQVEQVVAIFLEFVNISLYSIMNKAEVEALRVRDTRIAMMMHQQAMSQQQ